MSAAARGADGRPGRTVAAWDWPTRVFKWALVAAVLVAWLTQWGGDAWLGWHIWNGYAVLTLLAFRLIWGFAGSSTSRFAAWLPWPWRTIPYAIAILRRRAGHYLGHNPLGACTIVVLLGLVTAQATSGLFTVDSNGVMGGPFSNLDFGDPTPVQKILSRYHHLGFTILLAFVTLHVAANLFHQFVVRDPVITAMVTGRKPARLHVDEPEMRPARPLSLRALIAGAGALALVFGGVRLFGGHLP